MISPYRYMDWKNLGEAAKAISGVIAIIVAIWKLPPLLTKWWDRRTLLELPGGAYSRDDVSRYIENYIQPDCLSVDPAGQEDFRCIIPARESIFSKMDAIVKSPGINRYVIVLADSGMGKTAFLLNYYVRHRRRWRTGGIALKLVPLALPGAAEAIAAVPEGDRMKTVLLLDALDEDQQAIKNHWQRIEFLIERSQQFRAVVITCRSQFFPKDEEIPSDLGVINAFAANGPKKYSLQKLYLAPFTDDQVSAYLRRAYRWGLRRKAREVVVKIPDLIARPLLLTYVQDITASADIKFAFQMYELVIQKWCERERGFVAPDKLREFSECLAVEMFLNRGTRQMERIPKEELQPLASRFGIELEEWKLAGRSLLNRDAAGNYKFSHRSIFEYLFVKRFTRGPVPPHTEPWTDLMQHFMLEMLRGPNSSSLLPVIDQLLPKIGVELRNKEQGSSYVFVPARGDEQGFFIGATPVTVAAYRLYTQATNGRQPARQGGDDHPVVNVTWQEAAAYCEWAGGRLPTEWEWQHAALAGSKSDWYGPLDKIAWYKENSNGATHPVAQKKPNAWGLYDTLGNVWEWCEDHFERKSVERVIRGGSWNNLETSVRASLRFRDSPDKRSLDVGFRCLRPLP